jgi:hypothetical protein
VREGGREGRREGRKERKKGGWVGGREEGRRNAVFCDMRKKLSLCLVPRQHCITHHHSVGICCRVPILQTFYSCR